MHSLSDRSAQARPQMFHDLGYIRLPQCTRSPHLSPSCGSRSAGGRVRTPHFFAEHEERQFIAPYSLITQFVVTQFDAISKRYRQLSRLARATHISARSPLQVPVVFIQLGARYVISARKTANQRRSIRHL